MRLVIVLVCATGCGYQLSYHVGPRVDASGRVGVEVGATMGAAVFPATSGTRAGAVVASVEGTPYITTDSAPVREARPAPSASHANGRAAIRGMLEWIDGARPPQRRYLRTSPATRFGVYAGVDLDEHEALGLVGVTAGMSPWVWGYHGHASDQWLGLGVRLAAEVIPDETGGQRIVLRALLQADVLFHGTKK